NDLDLRTDQLPEKARLPAPNRGVGSDRQGRLIGRCRMKSRRSGRSTREGLTWLPARPGGWSLWMLATPWANRVLERLHSGKLVGGLRGRGPGSRARARASVPAHLPAPAVVPPGV